MGGRHYRGESPLKISVKYLSMSGDLMKDGEHVPELGAHSYSACICRIILMVLEQPACCQQCTKSERRKGGDAASWIILPVCHCRFTFWDGSRCTAWNARQNAVYIPLPAWDWAVFQFHRRHVDFGTSPMRTMGETQFVGIRFSPL